MDSPRSSQSSRLESWKEIAQYLSRTVRTVQRWEREQGLPIHRLPHNKLSSVFADTHELDAWWDQRRSALEAERSADEAGGAPVVKDVSPSANRVSIKWNFGFSLATGALLIALAALVWQMAPSPTLPHVDSVAVLPFSNEGGGANQFLASAVTNELVRYIARVRQVRVLGSQSATTAATRGTNVVDIARQLKVDGILTGTVGVEGTNVQVRARLLHRDSGRELWTGQYRGPFHDRMQPSGAAIALVRDLVSRMWPDESVALRTSRSEEAYLAYLRGAHQLNRRTPDALRNAAAEFTTALRIEPTYADAHAGLADAQLLMGIFGALPADRAFALAKGAAQRALEFDPENPVAYTSLAFATELHDHDWHMAEEYFKRALTVSPSHVGAHHWYGLLLDSTLRGEAAVRELETAVALEPMSLPINSDLGMVLWHNGRFKEAVTQLEKTVAMDPTYADAHNELAAAYLYSRNFERANAVFRRARELGVDPARIYVNTAIAYAVAGRMPEARDFVRRLDADPALQGRVSAGLRSAALFAVGEHGRGLDELARNEEMFDANLLIGPMWQPVHRDPRFRELVRRHGFFDLAEKNEDFRGRLDRLLSGTSAPNDKVRH